jgi:hypothetical protein
MALQKTPPTQQLQASGGRAARLIQVDANTVRIDYRAASTDGQVHEPTMFLLADVAADIAAEKATPGSAPWMAPVIAAHPTIAASWFGPVMKAIAAKGDKEAGFTEVP